MKYVVWIILVVLVAILALVGALFFFSLEEEIPTNLEPTIPIEDTLPDEVIREAITAKHQYKDGMHIVEGEIELPTPCHTLDTMIIVRESFPEQVTIEFTTTATDELCIQVITARPFAVEFAVSEQALITATLNNEPTALNLIKE